VGLYCSDNSDDPASDYPAAREPDEVHVEVECNALILVSLLLFCACLKWSIFFSFLENQAVKVISEGAQTKMLSQLSTTKNYIFPVQFLVVPLVEL
jgi:hypothetical protein